MNSFNIAAPSGKITGTVHLPASKSISNRLLILQSLAKSKVQFPNLSTADDTVLMQKLLQKVSHSKQEDEELVLDCQNAGTVLRFLTAYLAFTPGNWILTGSKRMLDRPIRTLAEALMDLGANISYVGKEGFPPLKISGRQLQGEKIVADASVSSQYISALLMIAPMLKQGLEINLQGAVVSRPYIQMTLDLLRRFEIKTSWEANTIKVNEGKFKLKSISIEPDWSSAAFWYQVVALSTDASLFIPGLSPGSIQGDSILPTIFEPLGVDSKFDEDGLKLTRSGKQQNHIEFDFSNHPDLAMPFITTCGALGIKGLFTGLESLRIKESDRLTALENILHQLNIPCSIEYGRGFILPGNPDPGPLIQTENKFRMNPLGDHRLAMMLAPLALIHGNIEIEDPQVVTKSYPQFWQELKNVGFIISSR